MRDYSVSQQVEDLGEYASAAVDKDVPDASHYTVGTTPLSTLPAKWWNWFIGKLTKNVSQTSAAFNDIYGELLDLLSKAGITPGVSGSITPQLHSALTQLFEAAPDPANRRVSTNKTIDYTKAWVEKLFVDTAGVVITFPDISGQSSLPYKHAEIYNTSPGNITVNLPGSTVLTILPTFYIRVLVVKLSNGQFSWTYTKPGSVSSGGRNDYMIRDGNGRSQVTTPSAADDIANKGYVDNHINATTGIHGATSAAAANTLVIRDSAGRAKVAAPSAADDIARKDTVDAVQTNLNTHINATTGIHGATSAAAANTLVIRDSAGRAKVAAPSASDDIARKDTVDAVQTNLTTHINATTGIHGATSAATANTLLIRDSAGRAKVAAPSASDDIARKDTVDAVQTNLTTHINATTGIHGATSAAAANTLVIRDTNGRAKVAPPLAADDIARKDTVDAAQTNLNTHINATTGIHGATSAAAANTLIIRDSAGRAKVAAPSAADDIANKDYVDNRIVYRAYSGNATLAPLNVGQLAVVVWTFSSASMLTFPSPGTYAVIRDARGSLGVIRMTNGGPLVFPNVSYSPAVLYVLRIS